MVSVAHSPYECLSFTLKISLYTSPFWSSFSSCRRFVFSCSDLTICFKCWCTTVNAWVISFFPFFTTNDWSLEDFIFFYIAAFSFKVKFPCFDVTSVFTSCCFSFEFASGLIWLISSLISFTLYLRYLFLATYLYISCWPGDRHFLTLGVYVFQYQYTLPLWLFNLSVFSILFSAFAFYFLLAATYQSVFYSLPAACFFISAFCTFAHYFCFCFYFWYMVASAMCFLSAFFLNLLFFSWFLLLRSASLTLSY